MNNEKSSNKTILRASWIAKRAVLFGFDVLAWWGSFFLALVMRFYASGQFLLDAGIYLETFHKIAPYFSAITILVFAVFGLYSSRWKYAGFNDMVRIILANAVMFVVLFAVTYLFFVRMPLTFYFLGSGMLFCLTVLSRFALSIFDYLTRRYESHKNSTANVMIVGTGDTASYVRRLLERKKENPSTVKCFFSYDPSKSSSPINGVPVLNNTDNFEKYVKSYKIDLVCFASRSIPDDVRKTIGELCKNADIDTRDYSDALEADFTSLSFSKLMRCIDSPVRIRHGNTVYEFSSGEEAGRSIASLSRIESVTAVDGVVVVDVSSQKFEKNDINEEWVKKTEEETGEKISFF